MSGFLFVVLACLCWAIDTLIRYPLVEKGLSPLFIVWVEHLLLTLFFLPRALRQMKSFSDIRMGDAFSFFIIGVVGSALATFCFTEAFRYLNPSLVILLQKFQPVVAITLAAIVLKEPIGKGFLFWAFVCIVGGVLVSFPDVQKLSHFLMQEGPDKFLSHNALYGYGLVLVSVSGWGASTTFGKKLSERGYSAVSLMLGRFSLGFLALCFFTPWLVNFSSVENTDYIRLFVMVLLSGVIALYFYYKGLSKLSAKTCAIVEMFFPFFAVVVNWFFLDKQLTEIQLIGGGILASGSLIIQLKKY